VVTNPRRRLEMRLGTSLGKSRVQSRKTCCTIEPWGTLHRAPQIVDSKPGGADQTVNQNPANDCDSSKMHSLPSPVRMRSSLQAIWNRCNASTGKLESVRSGYTPNEKRWSRLTRGTASEAAQELGNGMDCRRLKRPARRRH
jgi:hypothetical protein